jgi:hypothetical protein
VPARQMLYYQPCKCTQHDPTPWLPHTSPDTTHTVALSALLLQAEDCHQPARPLRPPTGFCLSCSPCLPGTGCLAAVLQSAATAENPVGPRSVVLNIRSLPLLLLLFKACVADAQGVKTCSATVASERMRALDAHTQH